MDIELIKTALLIAGIPIGIYLYHRYMKIRGDGVTWDELVDTFTDPEFWKTVDTVRDEYEKE